MEADSDQDNEQLRIALAELQRVREQRDQGLYSLSKRLDDCQRLLLQQSSDSERALQRAEMASMRLEDFLSCRRPSTLYVETVPIPSPVALPSLSMPVITPIFSPSVFSAMGEDGGETLQWDEGVSSQHIPAADSNTKALQAEVQELRNMVKSMAEDAGRFSETVGTLRGSLRQQQQLTEQYKYSYQRLSDRLNAIEADLRGEVLGRGNLKPLMRYIDEEESPRACLQLLRDGCVDALNSANEDREPAKVDITDVPMHQDISPSDDAVVGLQVAIHSKQPLNTTGARRAVLAELNKAARTQTDHSVKATDVRMPDFIRKGRYVLHFTDYPFVRPI